MIRTYARPAQLVAFTFLLVACGGDGDAPERDGGAQGSDATFVVRTCSQAAAHVGEPCEPFVEGPQCSVVWDFYMGRCGYQHFACEEGVVVEHDLTTPCGRDAGTGEWCEDYAAPPAGSGTDCRSDNDCGEVSGSCWVPGDTSGFYVAGFCPRECDDENPCAEGSVCVPLNGGSECAQCRPACTEESCSLWETCGDDSRCRPQSCEGEGYVCPPRSRCAPGSDAEIDEHGCTVVPCAADSDCGCGACVGRCVAGPGRCQPPVP